MAGSFEGSYTANHSRAVLKTDGSESDQQGQAEAPPGSANDWGRRTIFDSLEVPVESDFEFR
ncbi:hypothetical protein FOIG_02682 [Fusarium odoratissimum NRRL 54006]|uniref:Uncharacterized protein n=2 Tax=Fusarium oxysporum species complex TaxID=171631 RepID=X0LGC7_FUSO5|nr:uncharacterized protein FOIG_02682 [Fusarium odoratissimum NRRL 54006]EXM07730.1 hypothetical protein FOIG_02682 [Fusarium odoratissimum NRRL 54006]TXC10631.1 hypothetical protein FocTR4_00004776 [Fusarium oxysporum f. sp. cubense]